LNVDRRVKTSLEVVENSATAEIWPAPPATATVVSLQPRWLMVQTQPVPGRPLDGGFLTKELQRELGRVGCYGGEINGVWTQSTRRAIQTFINRVNATLPTERPDHILLAILQSYPDKTCKKPCASDETSAPDGRCVPGAIAGLATKTADAKSVPLVTRWSATETAAADDDAASVYKPPRARLTAPLKPPPAPRIVTAPLPPKHTAPPRVATGTREQSRPTQHSEFVRTLFQRLDNSMR
jgi:peptidoglycan hydrolase-like protein with peptidoglycan-binding domain